MNEPQIEAPEFAQFAPPGPHFTRLGDTVTLFATNVLGTRLEVTSLVRTDFLEEDLDNLEAFGELIPAIIDSFVESARQSTTHEAVEA